eukprot:scaffold91225_cov27-Tisochrysis_lutea.AAC.3
MLVSSLCGSPKCTHKQQAQDIRNVSNQICSSRVYAAARNAHTSNKLKTRMNERRRGGGQYDFTY